ncbi:hypothetical protein HYPSUDRAFT_960118 [Hypholoma sublateritium FD-334 SS-4]|uniref:Uncharacterized protein n=1 Tax=Hypholoma sublateritium (strain FD-334 SS-4) TaxID=945553 RepID=A0A0D2KUT5_HYPSF|nr:hypothetical protein HYPSUDRAFT_960118 [Hypholoma sublateritium FD-334 SS-4]
MPRIRRRLLPATNQTYGARSGHQFSDPLGISARMPKASGRGAKGILIVQRGFFRVSHRIRFVISRLRILAVVQHVLSSFAMPRLRHRLLPPRFSLTGPRRKRSAEDRGAWSSGSSLHYQERRDPPPPTPSPFSVIPYTSNISTPPNPSRTCHPC